MPGRKRSTANRDSFASRLGMVIRKRRQLAELSQEGLAERAGLSKNYVGNLERGEYAVTVTALIQVARGLGTRASEILAQSGE